MGYGMKGPMSGNKLEGGYKQGQMQQFTPEQMKLFSQMFGNVGPDSFLSRLAGGDQSMFEQMEKPAMRQFQELQGGLASRFSGMGMGGRKSSGFQNAANQQTSDFAQQLQANRLGLQNQAIQDLSGLQNTLLNQKPYENYAVAPKEKKPWWQTALKAGAPVAGAVVGGLATSGNPAGITAGLQAGSAFSQAF